MTSVPDGRYRSQLCRELHFADYCSRINHPWIGLPVLSISGYVKITEKFRMKEIIYAGECSGVTFVTQSRLPITMDYVALGQGSGPSERSRRASE
jgi:hypothetical protein